MMHPRGLEPGDFSIAEALWALAEDRPVVFPAMETVTLPGPPDLTVHLNMDRDPVQNALRRGGFYEAEDLAVLKSHIKDGAEVVDIGANIGNHLMWFLTQGGAVRVWPVEPNPLALAPLLANIVVNGLWDRIRPEGLGFGLSDQASDTYGMKRHKRNLGATKMFAEQGDLPVLTGDALLSEARPDVIKIDVEGMEMQVLAGLEATIARHHPVLMIEVEDTAVAEFGRWCDTHGYRQVHGARVSAGNANYIVVPEAQRVRSEG